MINSVFCFTVSHKGSGSLLNATAPVHAKAGLSSAILLGDLHSLLDRPLVADVCLVTAEAVPHFRVIKIYFPFLIAV